MPISEKFIHEQLLEKCESLVTTSKEVWRAKKNPSIIVAWPSEPIQGMDGEWIEDEILAELPAAPVRQVRLQALLQKTKAYGVLVIELQPHALVAIFESPHGARSWTTRLEYHGDTMVLSKTEIRSNVEHLGFLWSPKRGIA